MLVSDIQHKKILYAALDWGFGHVTRSIGIIRELVESKNELIVACNEEQKQLFSSYFPHIKYEFLDGYNFSFSGNGNWTWDLWKQRKAFFKTIKYENYFVEEYVKNKHIDFVISDHRYGFYSTKIPSIFVTHQLNLPIPKLYFFVQNWHEKQMQKFSIIWVLDDEKFSLAGKLSAKTAKLASKFKNLTYIGWKSRFLPREKQDTIYDFLIVVSGPKPYSERLLDEVIHDNDLSNKKVAVLHPNLIQFTKKPANFDFYLASNLKENDFLFYQSNTIISRSGYSTLMDLKILGKKAILTPTKGQKEQEYLFKKVKSHDD